MATIGNIAVKISANTKQFIGGMGRAVNSAKAFGARIGGLVAKVAKFGAVLVTAAVAGLTALTVKALGAVDSMSKFADRVGVSTRMLAGLEHGAALAGVSSEALQGSFERMVRRVGLFAEGSGAAARSLAKLGFAQDELLSKNTGEQFQAIADSIALLPTHAERSAAAFEIFGRQGQELLPILLGGAKGINAMVAEADALGLTFDRVGGAKVEAFNDAMTRLKALFTGLGRQIAIVLAPSLEALAERFTSAATSAGGMQTHVTSAFKGIIGAIGKGADILLILQIGWKATQHVVAGAIAGIVGIQNLWVQAGGRVLEFFGFEFQQGIVDSFDSIAKGIAETADTFGQELDVLTKTPWPSDQAEKFFAQIEADAQKAAEATAKAGQDMAKALQPTSGGTSFFTTQLDFFRQIADQAARIAGIATDTVSKTKTAAGGGLSSGSGALQRGSSAAASAVSQFAREGARRAELATKRLEDKVVEQTRVLKAIRDDFASQQVAGFA